MTRDQIRDVVWRQLHRIAPEVSPSELQPTESLREQLDIDSFDFLQFILGLHRELGVDIPESDYRHLSTLEACVDYLAGRLVSQQREQPGETP